MEKLILRLKDKIKEKCGIIVSEVQYPRLVSFINEIAKNKNLSEKDFVLELFSDDFLFEKLIEKITIGETYFFREEKQFDFLKNQYFPRFKNKEISILSCACSSGEEAYSLLALATSSAVKAEVFACDIDTVSLSKLKKGVYTKNSFRTDGSSFTSLLKEFAENADEENFVLKKEFTQKVNSFKLNIAQSDFKEFNKKFDLIFLRNVFIYFEKPTRTKILTSLEKILKDDGLIFLSMNEIGCLFNERIPETLKKSNWKNIYFLEKNNLNNEIPKKTQKNTEKPKEIFDSPVLTKTIIQKKEEKKEKEEKNTNQKTDIKKFYEEFSKKINNNDFNEALTFVKNLENQQKDLFYYFCGIIEFSKENFLQSSYYFETSASLNKKLWPAHFYSALCHKKLCNFKKEFISAKNCLNILEKNEFFLNYDFLIDSFNHEYIKILCQKIIDDGKSYDEN